MRLLNTAMLLLILFIISGCLTPAYYYDLKKKSAQHTECKADELVIEDDEGKIGGEYHRWKVECAGKRYLCTETSSKPLECYPITE